MTLGSIGSLPQSMTGVYLILVELTGAVEIRVRSGRSFALEKGFYGYVGSALNGLAARTTRHLSISKKRHWHIDYLLDKAVARRIICAETNQREECLVAQALSQILPAIPAFGCSDCRCSSHLFFSEELETMEKGVLGSLKQRNLRPLVFSMVSFS